MRRRLHHRLLATAALLVFFALALDTAGKMAVTTDEPLHLTRAIAMRQTGFMRVGDKHAPLTHRLMAGLLATDGPLPDVTTLSSWPTGNPYFIGRELLWRDDLPTDRVVWLGRLAVAGLGVALGALLAAWAWSLSGGSIPATAAVLVPYAFSPNLLAAASLATTDMAATVTWFAAVYTWWRYWQRPGRGRWLLAAVALGLALAAKLTGVLLLPVGLALAYAGAAGARPWPPARPWWRPALVWAGLLPLAALVLWALYGFEVSGGVPMPAYWQAWRLLLTEVDAGHPNFFMGQVVNEGSWLYFPVALLLKTPLPQLALFLLAAAGLAAMARRRPDWWRPAAFLLLPAAVCLAVAAASRLNYGYRHALPAIPFLMVAGAWGAAWLWDRPAGRARTTARAALLLGLAWVVIAGLRAHPDHLAYFNELARGQGYRYLGDSNLDWGQDLGRLGAFARQQAAETGRQPFFSYTGAADPAHYGLSGSSLTERFNAGDASFAPANPAAGQYAINVSDLQGVGLTLGNLREIDLYDWFRRRAPRLTLGETIFVYDVFAADRGEWLAHCATSGRLLSDAEAERLVGVGGLRHVTFDCQTSWVFPGNTPGWYVLPAGALWVDAWLGTMGPEVVYRHRANAYGPEYVIAYWAGGPYFLTCEGIDSCPSPLRQVEAQGGGPAELWAYGEQAAEPGVEWVTVWQVNQSTAAPLSVQAHLVAADGARQVADGLGFPAGQWRPGDSFMQRHLFPAPGSVLETALYDYTTLQLVTPITQLAKNDR